MIVRQRKFEGWERLSAFVLLLSYGCLASVRQVGFW